ncbi:beta-ketoacyl-[acyl-carrier-protein] synthase family protein [Salinifilum aidingensis]
MSSAEPAAITGIGLVTPAGIGRAANWTTVCAGNPTTRELDALTGAPVTFASTVPDTFDADRLTGRKVSRHYDRSTQLALVAAHAALNEANIPSGELNDARVAVIIGTAFGGQSTFEDNHRRHAAGDGVTARFLPKGLVNMTAGVLSLELGATGPNLITSTACASGATALGMALDMLRTDRADIVIAGGADASVTPLTISGFDKLRALSRAKGYPPTFASSPFDTSHDGFVLAEGAGILTMERTRDAASRGARPYAHLAGHGDTADAYHVTAPDPDGRGARIAIGDACRDAGLAVGDVDYVNAHATSTPTGDGVEAWVIADTASNAAVSSTKGVTGHTMGAAGAIEAAYTAVALRYGAVPPTANLRTPCDAAKDLDLVVDQARPSTCSAALSTSFGFGGHNAVLAFTPP